MKRILLLTFVLGFVFSGFAQRATVSKELRSIKAKRIQPTLENNNVSGETSPFTAKAFALPAEENIGGTQYDLQTNSSMQNRIYVYDDETIGGTYTLGFTPFSDRGTGYNYYDGTAWGEFATEEIESDRTGWPAYAPWGENGEIVISHYSGAATAGLAISRRTAKGTGEWTQVDFHSPASNAEYLWPRMTTGGVDHSVMHVVAITMPVANEGAIYEDLDGAVLYSRSEDGGDNWSIEHELFDELSSDFFTHFSGDTYDVQAEGDNVAILVGDTWTGLDLMKSTDGGDSWTHTEIWEHPYPMFDPSNPVVTNTFYCADGAHSLDFDESGKVHVVFGINGANSDGDGLFWLPYVGGVVYWNEDRPTFGPDTSALCPYSDCEYTELIEDYNHIGWMQDLNGNDTIDIEDPLELAAYYLGSTSMPQIHIDDQNRMFVVYSSITEGYTGGITNQTYRHLWCRTSPNGEWWGPPTDLTSSLEHVFDECVFPSIAPTSSEESFYLVYQRDDEPGLHIRGDEDPVTDNFLTFMEVNKEEVWSSVEENNIPIFDYDVAQNYPNPFTGTSVVKVNVRQATSLTLEVVNMMGQQVYSFDAGVANPGVKEITIDASKLTTGVYFYTVRAGETSITKKMIVE